MNGEVLDPDEWLVADPPRGALPLAIRLPELPPKWSAPAADHPLDGIWKEKEGKIDIKCTMSLCDDGLHCFLLTKHLSRSLGPGTCRTCHQPLISMRRVARRNLDDIDNTFAALQREAIRHYFWHVPFGDLALNYARRAGLLEFERRIVRRLRTSIAAAEPVRDGQQTPTSPDRANALHYAQHAVAACCRRCVAYWQSIDVLHLLTIDGLDSPGHDRVGCLR